MQNLPLVSVVIPVYNQEKFVGQAIESVLNQTYKNLQVLVSDDCSQDRSPEIIKEYAQRDSRIEVLYNERNLGICGNFNKLFDHVKGEYVAFFSGDDVMMPEKIMTQYEIISKDEQIAVVHHNAWFVDEQNQRLFTRPATLLPPINPLDWALKVDWFHYKKITSVLPTSCLARTGYYLKARYDERLKYKHELLFTIEDYNAKPNAKWVYLKAPLMHYRYHQNNFSNNPTYASHLNSEKTLLADLAEEKCPELQDRIRKYKLFTCYEAILYKQFDESLDEVSLRNYFNNNATTVQKMMLGCAVLLQKMNLYPIVSKMLHYLYFRPVYSIRYFSRF